MAKIPMRSILTIFWAFATCCNCQSIDPGVSSSWAKLQISPDALSSMEYGNFLIDIYEHAHNHKATKTSEKKYFYSPIAILDHKSAVSVYNNVTKQPEMRFRIEMWNEKVQNEVVKHLFKSIDKGIQPDNVKIIPLENVILASKRPSVDYSLSPVWANYDKSKTLKLSLSCYDQKVCDGLANEMRSNPEQFDHFKLLYSLSSQKSQTKHTSITIDSVISGQMVTALLQKFKKKKEIFLTANDEKKMLTETTTNIRMDTFDESEVVTPETETQILNILKDLLVTSRTTIKEQCDKMWDSVFWNEDNYRPDKTTKTLNEIIKKLDTETQKKLADMFEEEDRQSVLMEMLTSSDKDEETRQEEEIQPVSQSENAGENEIESTEEEQFSRNRIEKCQLAKNQLDEQNLNSENKERIQHNYNSNNWADIDGIISKISEKMSNESDSSRRNEILKEDVAKLLQESRDHVLWDGDKFVPKPMKLARINLAKYRGSHQSFQDRNVLLRYSNAELSAPIKFLEHAEFNVVNEWENIKDELKETKELLKTTIMNLAKSNTELINVKGDLGNTRMDLINKLEGTMNELVKTKIDLEKTTAKTVEDLIVKLNVTQKGLTEMKIITGNLSTVLAETVINLGKTDIELNNAKNDFTNTKIGLASKIEGTRIELVKTKIDLEKLTTDLSKMTVKAVDDLTVKLNATQKELGEMKIITENLLMEHQESVINLAKTDTELNNVKSDFTDTRIDLANKLEGTRIELMKTKIDLEKTTTDYSEMANKKVDDLTVKLNVTQKELAEIKIITGKFSAELKETVMNLAQTNTELTNVKSDLNNTRSDFALKLEGTIVKTNNEIEKTNADFKKTVDVLSKKIIELPEMKMSVGNLSLELKGSKQELTQIKIELEKKETKEELTKTRSDVRKTFSELSTNLNANSQQLGHELKTTEDKLRNELRETSSYKASTSDLSNLGKELRDELKKTRVDFSKTVNELTINLNATSRKLETTTTNLALARSELSGTKSTIADLTTKLNAREGEIVNIRIMPTSCEDLRRMGQKINGFFLVKGSKKMETVYCDFYSNGNDKQKWIGYADVKSAPVHFYVQKSSSFNKTATPIPFDLERVNDGNAMNLRTGVFMAPRRGTYFFSFTGLARFPASSSIYIYLYVGLYLNGVRIGLGRVEEANNVENQWSPLTLQSTLNLKLGDRVWVQIDGMSTGVYLLDSSSHYTHFTGFMLEEEIVASL